MTIINVLVKSILEQQGRVLKIIRVCVCSDNVTKRESLTNINIASIIMTTMVMVEEQKRQQFKQLTSSNPSLKLKLVDLNISYAKSLLAIVYTSRNKYNENMSPY